MLELLFRDGRLKERGAIVLIEWKSGILHYVELSDDVSGMAALDFLVTHNDNIENLTIVTRATHIHAPHPACSFTIPAQRENPTRQAAENVDN